jgi:hypothetical protein
MFQLELPLHRFIDYIAQCRDLHHPCQALA